MDRFLKPERFDADPNAQDASKQWNHWFCTFENFMATIENLNPNKLSVLTNYVSPTVWECISECTTYEDAIKLLKDLYSKPKNEIFARHLLATCRQEGGQTLDQFAQKLKSLAKDCDFKAVTAEQYRDDAVRDAFISGLLSNQIRQRLLEQKTLNFQSAFDKARSLELAERQSLSYQNPPSSSFTAAAEVCETPYSPTKTADIVASSSSYSKCFFCGNDKHPRSKCPARDVLCKGCGKKGHFQKVCLTSRNRKILSSTHPLISAIASAAAPDCLSSAVVVLQVNGASFQALIDTGSSESYVSSSVVLKNNWKIQHSHSKISMATTALTSATQGHVFVSIKYKDAVYEKFRLSVLPDLCADILLGHDFLRLHKSVEIPFGGPKPTFSPCSVTSACVEPPRLFPNLTQDCKPIATKSRRHTDVDERFIREEIRRLLSDGVIEPSSSPWRAQVLVVATENHKRRMVVDYSQTINKYTLLDAYPSPRIDEMVQHIANYDTYSTLDLKSAYHQIPIRADERPYTAFEASGRLYQFCRIPFGVTNGVACFQRTIDDIITREHLKDIFVYVDNITICGNGLAEHDSNLQKFLDVAEKYGLTFNEAKSVIASQQIKLLGYELSKGNIRPDPDRLQPLRDMAPPHDIKSLQRVVGLFAYYSQWISHFSDKIHPLIHNKTFPLPTKVLETFEALKEELAKATIATVQYDTPLVVETDASDVAIAATLNQNGRPVAFFSRTLSPNERHHSAIEKEAYAVVEAIRKWKHFLLCNHFKLITDQRSVAFIYGSQNKGKVKNETIARWRLELSSFKFDIVYRPGKENRAADTLSRSCCGALLTSVNLQELHASLCHPGVSRLSHFIRAKNLPFSMEDIRNVVARCPTCCEVKPRFFKAQGQLIKATQPFERLSLDFKGPLPSATRNHYLLTIIDEYSRFPFGFACSDQSAETIIRCLCQLFSIFGTPSYIHTDRGSSFMSNDVQQFLHDRGVATSRTTPYNPQGNGQVERLNQTLWKTILLALKSRNLPVTHWESVLLDALHSIRSLLCTATNATPHERIFTYNRRSTTGTTLPMWLTSPGRVLLKKSIQQSKYDPLCEEVDLLQCNPQYAHIRFDDGREDTVSARLLAPTGEKDIGDHPQETGTSLIKNSIPLSSEQPLNTEPEDNVNCTDDQDATTPDSVHNEDGAHKHNLEALIKHQQRVHPYCLRNRDA